MRGKEHYINSNFTSHSNICLISIQILTLHGTYLFCFPVIWRNKLKSNQIRYKLNWELR